MSDLQTHYATWYQAYHDRIQGWIAVCSVNETADMILQLDNLMRLAVELSDDPKVEAEHQTRLQGIASKVMRGIEFLPPDGTLAVLGLRDDALKLGQALESVLPHIAPEVVAAHWHQQRATAADTIHYLVHDPKKLKVYC